MLRRASYYGASPNESSKSTVDSRLRGSLCANDYDVKSSKAASLVRAQQGDRRALEAFFAHHLPQLRKWTRLRVPRWIERRTDADDLVQLAAVKLLQRLHRLSPSRIDSVQAYLRQTVLNLVRDEVRRIGRSPDHIPVTDEEESGEPSALDRLVGHATWQSYRRALARLGPRDRAAVIGRVQKGWSYEQLRTRLHVATANTARVVTHRAIERLVGLMSAGIRD